MTGINAKQAKVLRKIARELATQYPSDQRGVYQHLKRQVREHGFHQVVGSINKAAVDMARG